MSTNDNLKKRWLECASRIVNTYKDCEDIDISISYETLNFFKGAEQLMACPHKIFICNYVTGKNNAASVIDKSPEEWMLICKAFVGKLFEKKIVLSSDTYNAEVEEKYFNFQTPEEEEAIERSTNTRKYRLKSYNACANEFESFKCVYKRNKPVSENLPFSEKKIWFIVKGSSYEGYYGVVNTNSGHFGLWLSAMKNSNEKNLIFNPPYDNLIDRPKHLKIKINMDPIEVGEYVNNALNKNKPLQTESCKPPQRISQKKEFKYSNPRQTSKRAIKKLINNYYNDDHEFDSIIRNLNS